MALTLTEVETAISDVMTLGQSTTQDGTMYTAASMKTLQALRDTLQREASATNGTRPLFRAMNFGTMGYSGT